MTGRSSSEILATGFRERGFVEHEFNDNLPLTMLAYSI